jgi:hypothetical protein
MTEKEAKDCCDRMNREQANRNILAAVGVPEAMLNRPRDYHRYNDAFSFTYEDVNAELANVSKYTVVQQTV